MVIRIPKLDPIVFLVERRYPKGVKVLMAEDTLVGPVGSQRDRGILSDPSALQEAREAEIYVTELKAKSADEIQALVTAEQLKERTERQEKQEKELQKRFFSDPAATADFDYWAKSSYWKPEEAVALSLGKNPSRINRKILEPYVTIWPFAKSYMDRLMLVERAKTMGQLWDFNIPGVFLAWADRTKLSVPKELVGAVTALGIQVADWKTLYDSKREEADRLRADLAELRSGDDLPAQPREDVRPRERESLLKLVIGMAIKGYGYDPKASRSPKVREIVDDLQALGLSLHDDTIRKYLNEAKDLLPPPETE